MLLDRDAVELRPGALGEPDPHPECGLGAFGSVVGDENTLEHTIAPTRSSDRRSHPLLRQRPAGSFSAAAFEPLSYAPVPSQRGGSEPCGRVSSSTWSVPVAHESRKSRISISIMFEDCKRPLA